MILSFDCHIDQAETARGVPYATTYFKCLVSLVNILLPFWASNVLKRRRIHEQETP